MYPATSHDQTFTGCEMCYAVWTFKASTKLLVSSGPWAIVLHIQ